MLGPSLQQAAGNLGGCCLGEVLGVAESEPTFPAGAVVPLGARVSPGELPWQPTLGDGDAGDPRNGEASQRRPARTRAGAGRPSHNRSTTLSVASVPKPAPVTTVRPSVIARSCPSRTARVPGSSLPMST